MWVPLLTAALFVWVGVVGVVNRDLRDSRELSRADLDRQGLLRRFGQASARLMSPLL